MDAKKIVLCLLMLCSITISKAQIVANEVPNITEMSGEIVTKVKLAKEYFMNSLDSYAGVTYEERTIKLTNKVKELFKDYRDARTNQSKNKNVDIKDLIANEVTIIRQKLHYMNLPTDL